jgi:hypothetical protein
VERDEQDEVQLPEERVEDLEPGEQESVEVAGGSTYEWWKKIEP